MSTTYKYNFMFIIPNRLSVYPIPFQQFAKPVDEQGISTGFYSYDEYMTLPGKKEFSTSSGTHKLLTLNITSVLDLATKFPQYISQIDPTIEIVEGVSTNRWEDVDQSNILWILPTEPNIGYNYNNFIKVSPLGGTTDEGLL